MTFGKKVLWTMDIHRSLIFVFVLVCTILSAQEESELLDEILLMADTPLRDFSQTQQIVYLNDSVMRISRSSLTSLLNFNTPIYFKENGLGMVSSPSFRGTTASQTAVIWNGININSLSTGQTDFNAINIRGYDNIAVKSGGGSVAHGSSAIGGSVHLNSDIKFDDKSSHNLFANYGSFDTYGVDYSAKVATNNTSVSIGISRNSSENNYAYPNTDRINTNGQFYNNNLSVALGYMLDDNNFIKYYGNIFEAERHFSVPTPNAIKTKFADLNLRNMLEWRAFYNRFTSTLKTAYLKEEYKFYPFIENNNFTHGAFDSKVIKYDLAFAFNKDLKINAFVDYAQNKGEGSDIHPDTRQIGSASVMMKHHLLKRFYYELSFRQEITDVYSSPFLYAFGTKIKITDFYEIQTNVSKNFRIPTFNDMYWQGSGNPDLNPEVSNQAEITNRVHFKKVSFSITAFYNDIKDMIRWIPASGGIWQPENTDHVVVHGLEGLLEAKKTFGKSTFTFNGTYAYTISENQNNRKQLIYVPYYKATASITYSKNKFSTYLQSLYQGDVFTTSNNNPLQKLPGFMVSNLGFEYDFNINRTVGVQVLNLWDAAYEGVLNRPMPGRNFNIYINLKF